MKFPASPKFHPVLVIPGTLLFLATLALAPALAVAEDAAEVGAVELRGGAISLDWSLAGDFAGATLKVSRPDGSVFSKQFAAGERVTLSLFDAKGETLAEGSYTWELTAAPRVAPRSQRKAEAAREAGATEGSALGKGLTRSGSFSIVNGAFVVPGASTRRDAAREDQVIPDDLIVQGSLCVGFDCVNNESFGFDTIRLKENNTRIKFEDTSVGGFPTTDWQITANDSASGGASKFSIEDITGAKVPFTITGNAATNSIFVDSTGRVGFRTSTPVLDLHVSTSNTPAMRLEQTSAGGFTAQTWDIAGNEANFFVRDVTGGSRLPFRIRPGAPTSSIDISNTGKVGIGTASPATKLDVSGSDGTTKLTVRETSGTIAPRELLELRNNGAAIFVIDDTSAGSPERWTFGTNGSTFIIDNQANAGVEFTFGATGNFTALGTKAFLHPNPKQPGSFLRYVALEGPEAGTYFRGSAQTLQGEAIIDLPDYFSGLTEAEGVTVQLTPVGGWSQLYVAEKGPGRLVIRVAPGGADVSFDYLVQGIRSGYRNMPIEQTGQ